jgi:soluble lytic murein transglycosylase-like protein
MSHSTIFPLPAALRALFVALIAVATLVGTPASAAADAVKNATSAAVSCAEPIVWAERLTRMPEQLLASVALAESGRWDAVSRAKVAWPWTVNSGGEGHFFPTKAAAIAWVKTLRARGIRNIDVGCMQINLLHHPEAFESLDEAFDPVTNVAYAAAFLMRLFQDKRSWATAIGLYHSATPEFHFAYRRKVLAIWNQERRRVYEEKRRATLAAYEARRATLQAEARARDDARRAAIATN